ncbi:CD92-like protein [Schistosoma japonicum]|nr:CD92-like protein [Schistosoma japonicum]
MYNEDTLESKFTDKIFGGIFILINLVVIGLWVYVIVSSNLEILFTNYDCNGNVCGSNKSLKPISFIKINVTKQKYLHHTNFEDKLFSIPVCIQRCPDRLINSSRQLSQFMNSTGILLCDPRVPPLLYESQPRIMNTSLCPTLPLYPSIPIGGVCIPINFINHSNFVNFQFNADSEFTLSLYQIIICGLMVSVLSLLIIGAVRFVPGGFCTYIFGYSISAYSLFMMFLIVRLWIHIMSLKHAYWWKNDVFNRSHLISHITFTIILFICLFITICIICLNTLLRNTTSQWQSTTQFIVEALFVLLSDCLTELCGFMIVMLIMIMIGNGLLCFLSIYSLLHIFAMVEPIRLKFTGCLDFRQIGWIQYGFLPIYLLYCMWIIRYYLSFCQIFTTIFVSNWYRSNESSSKLKIMNYSNQIIYIILYQFIGSLSLASLFSLITWPLLQLLCLYRMINYAIKYKNVTMVTSTSKWEQQLQNFEWQIHHLDCNIFTLIVIEKYSFIKSWKQLNSSLVNIQSLNNIIELVRWSEVLLTLAKLASSAIATSFGLIYYSVRPPALIAFPIVATISFVFCYFISSAILSTLQHILSTIVICYCLQELKVGEDEIFGRESNFTFRHENFKCHLVKLLNNMNSKSTVLRNGCIQEKFHHQSSGSYQNYRNLDIQWIDNIEDNYSVQGFSLYPPLSQKKKHICIQ